MTSMTEMPGNVTSPSQYLDFYNEAQLLTGLVFYPIICFFGIIGNVLIVAVFCTSKLKTSTNVYLTALAVSDLVKLLNDAVYFAVLLLNKFNPKAGNVAFGHVYPYAHYVFNMSVCNTAWLTVSVAVERYIFVCHPLKAKQICSIHRARITSAAVCLSMAMICIPSALRYKTVKSGNQTSTDSMLELSVSDLWSNDAFVEAYTWVQNLLRSVIPLFVLTILNSFIILALRASRANRKLAYRNRITMMLICIILVFLVCITPDAILSTCFGYGYHEEQYLVKGIREYSDTLLALNSAVNFFLYCLFNKIFCINLKMICCRFYYRNKHQSEVSRFEKLQFSIPSDGPTGKFMTEHQKLSSRSMGFLAPPGLQCESSV